jgi:hypothetical protein
MVLVSFLAYSLILRKKVIGSSETSVYSVDLHCVTTQNIVHFNVTAERTSNPTYLLRPLTGGPLSPKVHTTEERIKERRHRENMFRGFWNT